jgi:hypothetical protein
MHCRHYTHRYSPTNQINRIRKAKQANHLPFVGEFSLTISDFGLYNDYYLEIPVNPLTRPRPSRRCRIADVIEISNMAHANSEIARKN